VRQKGARSFECGSFFFFFFGCLHELREKQDAEKQNQPPARNLHVQPLYKIQPRTTRKLLF
jgi:hypothetical protein